LDSGSLSVNQVLYKRRGVVEVKPPKTKLSRRQVKMTDKLTQYLKEYKEGQEACYWQVSDWQQINKPLPLDYFVFGFLDKPCSPSMLSHDFAKIAQKAGLKDVRFHDLRHTFASLMLMRGAPGKVISEALGHASVAFTLQTYAHVLSGMQEKAMSLLNDILPEGIQK
jgi:integrase